MNTLRDVRQKELAESWLNSENRRGIIYAAPRTGKCRISINVFNSLNPSSILIAYPFDDIKQSWENEFDKCAYDSHNVTFSTHMSLKKHINEHYDLIVIDECHCLSEAQIIVCQELFKTCRDVLGLTGTLAKETENRLLQGLKLPVIAKYSMEQAIEEKVICDYEIIVVKVPLDNRIKLYKGKTEKQKFDNVSYIINKMEEEGKQTFFMRLNRMRIIQNSVAKKNKTISLLKEHSQERILIFTGITKIADELGIPSYHSKSTEKGIFDDFINGRIDKLAVCKMGNMGTTFTPLNMVIINFFDSDSQKLSQRINRCMSMEYNNLDKKSHIYIICSTEETEEHWLKKSLSMFNKEKIKYI